MRVMMIRFEEKTELDEVQKAALRAAIIHGGDPFDSEGKIHWWQEFMVDGDLMPPIPHRIMKHIWSPTPALLGLDVNTAARGVVVNNKVNVAVPGLGLLMLNEVMVETDCCTERLNELMQRDRWRIVAVCPQPNQRRPDYVLGRVNKDGD